MRQLKCPPSASKRGRYLHNSPDTGQFNPVSGVFRNRTKEASGDGSAKPLLTAACTLRLVCTRRRNSLEVELQQGFRKSGSNGEWTMPAIQNHACKMLIFTFDLRPGPGGEEGIRVFIVARLPGWPSPSTEKSSRRDQRELRRVWRRYDAKCWRGNFIPPPPPRPQTGDARSPAADAENCAAEICEQFLGGSTTIWFQHSPTNKGAIVLASTILRPQCSTLVHKTCTRTTRSKPLRWSPPVRRIILPGAQPFQGTVRPSFPAVRPEGSDTLLEPELVDFRRFAKEKTRRKRPDETNTPSGKLVEEIAIHLCSETFERGKLPCAVIGEVTVEQRRNARLGGGGGGSSPKKTRRPVSSSGTICHERKSGVNRPGIEPVARPVASHLGEPGSIPSEVAPGFSHVGIVSDDAAGRRVFSETSRSSRPLHSSAVPYPPRFALIGSQDLEPPKSLHSKFYKLK
ncbi:hypothetical protein PR048_033248 [Dryococelus australis]|uniref:Uncharacterized protein n=1 Tax=Dryococelus australis TaxID=614101 RepID=A0ABQ9G115_9NEOP|nr:hypothetical protein PR048_033248 [Dryococelus australis]